MCSITAKCIVSCYVTCFLFRGLYLAGLCSGLNHLVCYSNTKCILQVYIEVRISSYEECFGFFVLEIKIYVK